MAAHDLPLRVGQGLGELQARSDEHEDTPELRAEMTQALKEVTPGTLA
jgi:hypothetical protein